jgi:hypothetical protein
MSDDAALALPPLGDRARKMQRFVTSPLTLPLWLAWKLPAALFCGLRCHELDATRCVTSVPYGWRSQNPFRSTYFAAQAMAAEFSTGALALLAVENAGVPVSTLIVDLHATFGKKAVSRATFRCEQGAEVFRAVQEAVATGEPRVVTLQTVGRMETDGPGTGEEVSRFSFTWSVKKKRG